MASPWRRIRRARSCGWISKSSPRAFTKQSAGKNVRSSKEAETIMDKNDQTVYDRGGRVNTSTSGLQEIRTRVHRRLLETMDLNEARRMPVEQLHNECSRRVD